MEAYARQPKAEFYIPTVVNNLLHDGKIRVRVLSSASQWYGVTYPEDKETVREALARIASDGHYPAPLWRFVNGVS